MQILDDVEDYKTPSEEDAEAVSTTHSTLCYHNPNDGSCTLGCRVKVDNSNHAPAIEGLAHCATSVPLRTPFPRVSG